LKFLGSAAEVGFKLRKGSGEETIVAIDRKQSQLFVDRTRSGDVGFGEHFSGRHAGPIRLAGRTAQVHIYVDRSSIEVFGNHGETVISELIFPKRSSDSLELYCNGGQARIERLDVWNLKSVYQ
jgi:fructan beta-fructosidase